MKTISTFIRPPILSRTHGSPWLQGSHSRTWLWHKKTSAERYPGRPDLPYPSAQTCAESIPCLLSTRSSQLRTEAIQSPPPRKKPFKIGERAHPGETNLISFLLFLISDVCPPTSGAVREVINQIATFSLMPLTKVDGEKYLAALDGQVVQLWEKEWGLKKT